MSFDFDPKSPDSDSSYKARYAEIERANDRSWYVQNQHRPFDAVLSVHSAGEARNPLQPLTYEAMVDVHSKVGRRILGGNMSFSQNLGPKELPVDVRLANAKENVERVCSDAGIEPRQLRILGARMSEHSSHPLTPLNVDVFNIDPQSNDPFFIPETSDFIYSYDPSVVLAATPADCPIMLASAETPQGTVSMLVHYSWRAAANGYIEQTDRCFDMLGVDRETLHIYLSPGAHAENFAYKRAADPRIEFPGAEGLFRDVRFKNDAWEFGIDTPRFAYDRVLQLPGIKPEMVYADTTDTGSYRSGHSSHNRDFNINPNHNTRDLLFMVPRSNALQ
jgi:copper oxidase (laccase) domain-containing protein